MDDHIRYRTSRLRGTCQQIEGKTVLTERYHEAPLKVTKTFRETSTGALSLCLMDVSPGLMDGDRYEMDFCLQDNTHLILTNQSFTKVHPTPHLGAETISRFTLGVGATLEYMPQPSIPYAGSRLKTNTRYDLSAHATLLLADIWTPGRTHRGEIFHYDSLSSQMEVYRNNKLLAWDHYWLQPSIHDCSAVGALEHYTHNGSFWIFSEKADGALLSIIRTLLPSPTNDQELLAAASLTAEHGICVRMLGLHVWQLQVLVEAIWAACRKHIWGYSPCEYYR